MNYYIFKLVASEHKNQCVDSIIIIIATTCLASI